MEGIRYQRPRWTVMRFAEDNDGRTDDAKDVASFWEEGLALDEAAGLNQMNEDRTVTYEVVEVDVSGVYPADENPPWLPDPERLTRRGYEKSK